MRYVLAATFEDGVLKPKQPLDLPPGTQVQIVVVPLQPVPEPPDDALDELEQLWNEVGIDSGGKRLTRDQLHERP